MDFKSLKNRSLMINYCLNIMRKRTIDEQLQDFSEMMETSLELQISYGPTDLEVKYEIGQLTASVRGLNETESVQQCKLDILHAIRVFCSFTNNPNRTFHRRQNVDDDFENCDSKLNKDVYSEIRLIKNRKYDENDEDDDKISNEMILIDPEVEQLKSNVMAQTTSESRSSDMSPSESPLILKICYSKAELRVCYEIEHFTASVVGVAESTCLQQCKLELLEKLKEHRHNGNVIDSQEAEAGPISSKASEMTIPHCDDLDRSDQIIMKTSNDQESLPVRCLETSGDSYAESAASPVTVVTSDMNHPIIDNKNDVIVNGLRGRDTKTINRVKRRNSTDVGIMMHAVRSLRASIKAINAEAAAMTPHAGHQTVGIKNRGELIFDSNENVLSLNMNGSSGSDDKTSGPRKNFNDTRNCNSNIPNKSQNDVKIPKTIDVTTKSSTSHRPMGTAGTSDLHQTDNKNDVIVIGSTCSDTKTTDEVTRGNSTDGGPALQAIQNLKTSVKAIEDDVDTSAMTPCASYQTAGFNTWGKYIFDSNENFMSLNTIGTSGSDEKTSGPSKNYNDIKNRGSNIPNESQNAVQGPRRMNLTTTPSTSYRPMRLSDKIRSTETIKKSAMENVADLMDNLQPNSLSTSTKTLLNILVEAKSGYKFNLGRIMDVIVQKAIDNSDKSGLYAQLCSEVNRKAQVDVRDNVRLEIPGTFKDELMKACDRVLKAGGVLRNEAYTHGLQTGFSTRVLPRYPERTPNTPRNPEAFDANTYVRTLGTCKFMGELFVRNSFKIIGVIIKIVGTFIKARDAHSLECLCVLLMTMGQTFEKINTSMTQMSPQQVYGELEQYSVAESRVSSLPKRTLYMINELLRARHNWVESSSVDRYTSSSQYNGRLHSEYRQHYDRRNNNNRPAPSSTSLRLPNDGRPHMLRYGRTQNSEQRNENKRPLE